MLGPALAPFAREIVRYRVAPFDAHVPITFAWGDRDVVTPPHQARRAARLFPGARHVTLTGCGHVPMLDDADLVARTILI
jgi:pimeloyl-ACP methyl ester carboxylesterase